MTDEKETAVADKKLAEEAGASFEDEHPHNRTMFIGDNLEVLRGLDSDSVDLVYLDPPFNSKKQYSAPIGSKAAVAAFKDTWTLSDVDMAWHDELRSLNPDLYDVVLAAQAAGGDGTMSYLLMMSMRLLELHRVMKPEASIYLHCDPTESHALKLMMDTIFGRDNFGAEITWKRTSAHNDSGFFGNVTDSILFYSPVPINVDAVRVPLNPKHAVRAYRFEDERGAYGLWMLTGAGTRTGESGQDWRGYNPTRKIRHWAVPTARMVGTYGEWIARNLIPGYEKIAGIHDRLDALDEAGLIEFAPDGEPKIKRYLAASKGQVPSNLWDDIPKVMGTAKEKTGYPTQKPLKLLERVIRASSEPGDIVLDPFAGCATTAIAAEKMGRQWIGIDISKTAAELVQDRMTEQLGLSYSLATIKEKLPRRTDLGNIPPYNSPENKQALFVAQEGICNGCERDILYENMSVDYIIPESRGGHDHISNLQLLCGNCNSSKGGGSMLELTARLLRRAERRKAKRF